MPLEVDPTTLTLQPGAAPAGPAPGQRPVVGALIAGYGCAVNPAHITKIEAGRLGANYFVRAFLQATPTTQSSVGGGGTQVAGTTVQAGQALLTPPLATEQEAFDACDAICSTYFLLLSLNPDGGGIMWPEAEDGSDRRA